MASTRGPRKRARGRVETLPSGSLRVKVYAGIDPLSGQKYYLTETVPAGPTAAKEAEKVRTRLLNQIDEQRSPKTRATVNQLLDRHMELLKTERLTRKGYDGYVRNHIRPLLGELQVARIDGEILDSFYAELRTCRAHCRGRKLIDHRTRRPHDCDDRCRPHTCRPLADSSVRQVHTILSGAFGRAIRWGWRGTNPIQQADKLPTQKADPHPPTPEQAARIVTRAFRDLDWGMVVWMAMVTGARRGELCAMRWDRVEYRTDCQACAASTPALRESCAACASGQVQVGATLSVPTSIAQDGAETWEKDTKTHQQRRITLDPQTVALLRAYRTHCKERAALLGLTLVPDARIFSSAPDGSTWLKPDSVGQRYARMCARLGWDMNIHQLRHYAATELIAAGVDVRTVAGRLGHAGGGSTTLRNYSAWIAEVDQRAAGTIAVRMPAPPVTVGRVSGGMASQVQDDQEDQAPYQQIAADLRAAIRCGAFRVGDVLPTMSDLADRYDVTASTAQRAVAALRDERLVQVARGQRARVA